MGKPPKKWPLAMLVIHVPGASVVHMEWIFHNPFLYITVYQLQTLHSSPHFPLLAGDAAWQIPVPQLWLIVLLLWSLGLEQPIRLGFHVFIDLVPRAAYGWHPSKEIKRAKHCCLAHPLPHGVWGRELGLPLHSSTSLFSAFSSWEPAVPLILWFP